MDASKLLPCTLFLIILLGSCNGSGSNDDQTGQLHSHSTFHLDAVNPRDILFFRVDDLKVGNKIPVYFPRKDISDSFAHLLSKEISDSIPFKLEHLPELLRFFSIPEGSPRAKAMENTLKMCGFEPLDDEPEICATYMESMENFVQKIFGPETPVQLLTTVHSLKSHALLQNYTVTGFRQIPTSKRVACHPMPYPYTVFSCHHRIGENIKVYKVWLTGEDGDKVDTMATCHMNTSDWTRDSGAFQLLGAEQGSIPVCHFFVSDNVVWVPKDSIDAM